MLAKQYRLPRSISFSNTKSFSTQYFRVLVKENILSYNRFGFVVSKKIDNRAVVRNRLRRILGEAVRTQIRTGSKDILFIVKQSFFKEKNKSVYDLVQSTLEKLL